MRPVNLLVRLFWVGIVNLEHCLAQQDCGSKLPVYVIAPQLGLAFDVASISIEADSA